MEKSAKRSISFFDCYDRFRFLQGIQRYLWASKGRFLFERGTTAIDEVIKRPADMAARYGGEEFALILPETSSEGAVSLAEKLLKSIYDLNLEHKNNSCEPRVTVSMGVATLKVDKESDFTKLISQADKALYAAKDSGRNRLSVFGENKI